MKKTALLWLLLNSIAACGSDAASVHVSWSLMSGGNAIDCPHNSTVVVSGSRNGFMTGIPAKITLPCTAGSGTLDVVSAHWSIRLELFDESGALLWTIPEDATTDLVDGQVAELDPVQIVYLGKLSLSWTFMSGSAPTTCAAQGVAKLRFITFRKVNDTQIPTIDDFECAPMMGTTQQLDEGNVTLELDLLDSAGNTMFQRAVAKATKIVPDQTTDLGSFEFDF